MFFHHKMETLAGTLLLVTDEDSVHAIAFPEAWSEMDARFFPRAAGEPAVMRQLKNELSEYFAGDRKKFSVPVSLSGTEFQVKAWNALKKVPYGKTWSYQDQALAMGAPKATRAVGSANNKNPICIIYPCHRIIAKTGKLHGFASDVRIKEALLRLEGAL